MTKLDAANDSGANSQLQPPETSDAGSQGNSGAGRGTGTLGKAIDVVTAIADARSPVRFTDLLSLTGQPRGTLHRNISNLLEEGLIGMNPVTHIYSLGPRLLQLAAQAWNDNELRNVAEPHLRALNQLAGETVHLAILQGNMVVYLDKFEPRNSFRMHSQIGRSAPVYCTGVGKAILSGLDDDEFETVANSISFEKFTENTITSVEALRKDRAATIKRGYAIDAEEHEAGIRCAAAPIRNSSGNLLGGLSVTAPAYRISDDVYENWTRWVQTTARAIGVDAGIKLGPRN
jgi:DNA-binding IclR family transcriptional regulator